MFIFQRRERKSYHSPVYPALNPPVLLGKRSERRRQKPWTDAHFTNVLKRRKLMFVLFHPVLLDTRLGQSEIDQQNSQIQILKSVLIWNHLLDINGMRSYLNPTVRSMNASLIQELLRLFQPSLRCVRQRARPSKPLII